METRYFNIDDLRAEGDTRKISGYGSVFGNLDTHGTVMERGAFKDSLTKRKVKMLWQHRADSVIGVWDSVTEDARGLRLEGTLIDTPRGNEAYKLLKAGAVDGLSIGFRTLEDKWEAGVRYITKADLMEVSVVTFPSNSETLIDAVRAAAMTKRDFEEVLTRDAGLSRTVARQILAGGFEAVNGKQDAADERAQLLELLNARAQLATPSNN